ncbi:hypothetical protein ACFE04_028950 [Oxalis oulophora]
MRDGKIKLGFIERDKSRLRNLRNQILQKEEELVRFLVTTTFLMFSNLVAWPQEVNVLQTFLRWYQTLPKDEQTKKRIAQEARLMVVKRILSMFSRAKKDSKVIAIKKSLLLWYRKEKIRRSKETT